jgi:hypothetical protein
MRYPWGAIGDDEGRPAPADVEAIHAAQRALIEAELRGDAAAWDRYQRVITAPSDREREAWAAWARDQRQSTPPPLEIRPARRSPAPRPTNVVAFRPRERADKREDSMKNAMGSAVLLLALLIFLPAPSAAQQEVRVQSGPSNAVSTVDQRLEWRQAAPDAATLATFRYTVFIDGAPFADVVGAVCTFSTVEGERNCTAPLPPGIPAGSQVTIQSFVVVPPPPPPASLRIVGGSGS